MKLSVKITNNKLPDIARRLPEAANVIVNQTYGPHMQEAARRRARVDTGAMRDGIRWEATGQGTGQLTGSAEYTVFHEYGTRYIGAQPMFRPALEEIGPQINDAFRNLEGMIA